jgi:integrase
MALGLNRLGVKELERRVAAGRYSDGGGLYLLVSKAGTKSWAFMVVVARKRYELGLGALAAVSVADARAKAAAIRADVARGVDPVLARDTQIRATSQQGTTFRDVATAYMDAHRAGWRSAKHAGHWQATLETYAYPRLGGMAVSAITTQDVLSVLSGLWTRAPETASRVRGRIEAVLDAAKAQGLRTGENPAAWRGNLAHLLPAKSRVQRVEHLAAMPYADVPAFYQSLVQSDALSAAALRLIILTAARSGEVTGMKWSEVDLDAALWTAPAERMKGGRPHAVPLSTEAVDLLRGIKQRPGNKHVFVGYVKGEPLADSTVLTFLRRLGHAQITVHGFRSSFRDWTADQTSYPREIAEAALAHANGDKVEASYRRTTFLARRREMMAAWSSYVAGQAAGNVVPMMRQGAA